MQETFRHALLIAIATLFLARSATAAVSTTEWGTIATPIEEEVTFQFEQFDLDRNFTDQYRFSLSGEAGATYAVVFDFGNCTKGCGNPDIGYGIYYDSGGLVDDPVDGVYDLATGDYAFQVKGTGMGSGNDAYYSGNVTFQATAASIVSPVPELPLPVMLIAGFWVVVTAARRARAKSTPPHRQSAVDG